MFRCCFRRSSQHPLISEMANMGRLSRRMILRGPILQPSNETNIQHAGIFLLGNMCDAGESSTPPLSAPVSHFPFDRRNFSRLCKWRSSEASVFLRIVDADVAFLRRIEADLINGPKKKASRDVTNAPYFPLSYCRLGCGLTQARWTTYAYVNICTRRWFFSFTY